jgi:hypothetical protein
MFKDSPDVDGDTKEVEGVTRSGCEHFYTEHNNYRETKWETRRWSECVDSAALIKQLDDSRDGVSNTQKLIDKFKGQLLQVMNSVGKDIVEMAQINEELAAIALTPSPFSDTGFFDQLITEENMSKRTGYTKRVDSYIHYKRRIELIKSANDDTFDVSGFISLNETEMDALGIGELRALAHDPAKRKQAFMTGSCLCQ